MTIRTDLSDQFRKCIIRCICNGYNSSNEMRQSACSVIIQVTVNSLAGLFKCTPVGRASDSIMAPTYKAIHLRWLEPQLLRLILGL